MPCMMIKYYYMSKYAHTITMSYCVYKYVLGSQKENYPAFELRISSLNPSSLDKT